MGCPAGNTYPAEDAPTFETFIDYFFSATVVVGIIVPKDKALPEGQVPKEHELTVEQARDGREWNDVLAGLYYVRCPANRLSAACGLANVCRSNQTTQVDRAM